MRAVAKNAYRENFAYKVLLKNARRKIKRKKEKIESMDGINKDEVLYVTLYCSMEATEEEKSRLIEAGKAKLAESMRAWGISSRSVSPMIVDGGLGNAWVNDYVSDQKKTTIRVHPYTKGVKKINYERAIDAFIEYCEKAQKHPIISKVFAGPSYYKRLLECCIEFEKELTEKPTRKNSASRLCSHRRRVRAT